jgi:carboxyl-terminal processing protease
MMRMAWIVAPAVAAAACVGALAWSNRESESARPDTFRELALFAEVLNKVKQDYVVEVDDAELMKAAMQGMLTSLDPHSAYLAPEDLKDLNEQTSGEYGGLGIEVTQEDGVVKVVSPMDETPASRAGVQAGDYLTAINGESIIGIGINEAVSRMRGPAGSSLIVTITREGAEPFDVQMTREKISIRAVTSRVEDGIGIIRVSTFNKNTTAMLKEHIGMVKSQAGRGLRGVVLDLRNNPGGVLEQAQGVSDSFLDGGLIAMTRGRNPEDNRRLLATKGDDLNGMPMVVLINGGSASASEIVAGALKDRGRALIVGTTSFGKGSVQTVLPLNSNRGGVKLTTSRYYTPNDISIQGAGIEPDVEVSAVRVDPDKLKKLGISEADLPKALNNEAGMKRRGPHVPEDQPPANWDTKQDYQLKRAKDLFASGVVAERLRNKQG